MLNNPPIILEGSVPGPYIVIGGSYILGGHALDRQSVDAADDDDGLCPLPLPMTNVKERLFEHHHKYFTQAPHFCTIDSY